MGPFDVEVAQIRGLGVAFTPFVNALLLVETRASGLRGHLVRVTDTENRADGGVDAYCASASETRWMPPGSSAWQFKRGDLGPAECTLELRGARRALEVVSDGGTYCLVLGADLNHDLIAARRDALIAEANEQRVLTSEDQIRVLDGNHLADWASDYPALAVGRVLGHPSPGAADFASWSQSIRHRTAWVSTAERDAVRDELRADIADVTRRDIRVEGGSGFGKTRLVMEACRGQEFEPLVAYVAQERDASADLARFVANRRTAVLVVDECVSRRHDKLAELLTEDADIKLVTIGEPGLYTPVAPTYSFAGVPDEAIGEFLQQNYPALWPEARRVVAVNSAGNFHQAQVISTRLLQTDRREAAALIERNDLGELLRGLVPGDSDFLLGSAMALFERVGVDRELESQLSTLTTYAGIDRDEARRALIRLEQLGLVARQGRYRTVVPHPFAIFLAAENWQTDAERIVSALLPTCDREMTLALLGRAADLGSYPPARAELRRLIQPEGPFGTLESIDANDLGEFVVRLAIVAPDETMDLLEREVHQASLERLKHQETSRRSLVWALGKLAWNSRLFPRAADGLLRLALAENEKYSNNASGTWRSLFGAVLPTTAAAPDERLEYLAARAGDADASVRRMVISAAQAALPYPETAMSEAELQRGRVVEPRGSVRDAAEASNFRAALLAILSDLASDSDDDVRTQATSALIHAFRFLGTDASVGGPLRETLRRFTGNELAALRLELEHEKTLARKGRGRRELADLIEFEQSLPVPTAVERLETLLNAESWVVDPAELQAEFRSLIDHGGQAVLDALRGFLRLPIKAGLQLGASIAGTERDDSLDIVRDALEANPEVLAGYLRAKVESEPTLIDDFLDGHEGKDLPPQVRLWFSRLGPLTDRSRARIFRDVEGLPPASAIRTLGWLPDLSAEEVAALARTWSERLASQDDYNALVDWFVGWLYQGKELGGPMRSVAWALIERRSDYPNLANERWEWARLAERFVKGNPAGVAQLVLDFIERHDLVVLDSDEEARLLSSAAEADPSAVWAQVSARLSSWRIQLTIRGWLTRHIRADVLADWVGGDLERARLLASIASAGADLPSDEAQLLFERFGEDPEIGSSLAGDFISGTWMGPASAHTARQVTRLDAWDTPAHPAALRRWARDLARSLEQSRTRELEQEAERQ